MNNDVVLSCIVLFAASLVLPSAAFSFSTNRPSCLISLQTTSSTRLWSAQFQPPYDPDEWVRWSSDSLQKFTGESLLDKLQVSTWQEIHESTRFAVLSHGTQEDPIYHYFNRGSLELFERTAEEIFTLPSRFSAPESERQKRAQIVSDVAVECRTLPEILRVTKTGKLFRAQNVIYWNVYNDEGTRLGQSAFIDRAAVVPVEDTD